MPIEDFLPATQIVLYGIPSVNITQYFVPYFTIMTSDNVDGEAIVSHEHKRAVLCSEKTADLSNDYLNLSFEILQIAQTSQTEWYCPDTDSIQVSGNLWVQDIGV